MTHPVAKPDWSNLDVIHRNTLPPRSSFHVYSNHTDALSFDPSRREELSLSGTWKFYLSDNPFEAPSVTSSLDTSKWGDIEVPGMWQLQGYGKGPQYTNMMFPFPVDPPNSPYTDNETGTYFRRFKIPKKFEGHQLRLRFEGVDSCFTLWVNAKEVGYSQGSRNPSEFDITEFVNDSENTLAVRVVQFCDGSYIEDQDQWWLSGIFRDVSLLAFTANYLKDVDIRTTFGDDYVHATLLIRLNLVRNGNLHITVINPNHEIVMVATKWTAETPNLYTVLIDINHTSFIPLKIGIRQVEIRGGLLLVNGNRIVIRGTNRHEHYCRSGRTVPLETLRHDLILMKRHNINAIRTCHQPNDPRLYDLADELGFWVIDEADLECHGFGIIGEAALSTRQKQLSFPERSALLSKYAGDWTSNNPAWKDSYIDRAQQLVTRDKLHPCVIIWSLGNEAFEGCNFQSMYDWIKAHDPTRPVHYEPDRDAKIVDIYSEMYPDLDHLIECGKKDLAKPMILCEFMHAMGNGPGGIKEYIDCFYKYPRLQGGFAWEWANHGLITKNSEGEEYYGYGGDFGDVPNDYNFVMDGLCSSDHMPQPGLTEYKKAIEPVQVIGGNHREVIIINRYDFLSLDHLNCIWNIRDEERVFGSGTISLPPDIQPEEEAILEIPPFWIDNEGGIPWASGRNEVFLNLAFVFKDNIPRKGKISWAEIGHEVARSQLPLVPRFLLSPPSSPSETSQSRNVQLSCSLNKLTITTSATIWEFNIVHGLLTSWTKNNTQVLHTAPYLSFYRPLTDNDRPKDGQNWMDKRLHQVKNNTQKVNWTQSPNGDVIIYVQTRCAPPVLEWSIDCSIIYKLTSSGSVHIAVKTQPRGINLPHTLARAGITLALPKEFDSVQWFGRGPGECYIDKKLSQMVGKYTVNTVDELWVDYEFPQETSNRTDTRWVKFSNSSHTSSIPHVTGRKEKKKEESLEIRMMDGEGKMKLFDFMGCHYKEEDIDKAEHPYELRRQKREEVILRIDARHHGLGQGSCGPKTFKEYAFETGPISFEVVMR
ncbi:hypothetical protein B7494_g5077 [Chlorociboria aeruginascens]|nr:hypothetical protein B7494_g5077 [Chlorociboria aeruginascens]